MHRRHLLGSIFLYSDLCRQFKELIEQSFCRIWTWKVVHLLYLLGGHAINGLIVHLIDLFIQLLKVDGVVVELLLNVPQMTIGVGRGHVDHGLEWEEVIRWH